MPARPNDVYCRSTRMSVRSTLKMYQKTCFRILKLVVLFSAVTLLLTSLLGEDTNRNLSPDRSIDELLSRSKPRQDAVVTIDRPPATVPSPADETPEKTAGMVGEITAEKVEFDIEDIGPVQSDSQQPEMDMLSYVDTKTTTAYTSAQPTQADTSSKNTPKPEILQNGQETMAERKGEVGNTQGVSTQGFTEDRDKKYLLSLSFLQGGPNFFYENFKIGLFYAIISNRAIVTLPFANHYGHKEEQFYWSFDDTFDRDVLRQLLPVVTPEEFRQLCNGSVDVLLMNPYTQRNTNSFSVYEHAYQLTRERLKELTNITIPPWEDMPMSVEEARKRYMSASKARCLGMYKPLDFWRPLKSEVAPHRKREIVDRIARHLSRAPSVQRRADAILEHLCHGQPFLSMHWRNRTGEMCQMQLRNVGRLDCTRLLTYITMATKKVVRGVEEIMSTNNLHCVYIAHPSYSWEIVEHMKARIPNVYTSKDILALDIPEVAGLNENYLLSLVEQEIVYRGHVFIASLTTNWSEFVAEERSAHNKTTIFLNEVPGVPTQLHKLI